MSIEELIARCHQCRLSVKDQGQIRASFIRVIEPTMIDFPVKLHQNLASSFQAIRQFSNNIMRRFVWRRDCLGTRI